MKRKIIFVLVLAVLVIFLSGCEEKQTLPLDEGETINGVYQTESYSDQGIVTIRGYVISVRETEIEYYYDPQISLEFVFADGKKLTVVDSGFREAYMNNSVNRIIINGAGRISEITFR